MSTSINACIQRYEVSRRVRKIAVNRRIKEKHSKMLIDVYWMLWNEEPYRNS